MKQSRYQLWRKAPTQADQLLSLRHNLKHLLKHHPSTHLLSSFRRAQLKADHQPEQLKPLPPARAPFLRPKANGSASFAVLNTGVLILALTDVVYLSLPVADGEDPEQLLKPYLDTIFSLTDVSEPLFKVVYTQHVSTSFAPIPTPTQSSILVSPALPPHLAEISDSASSVAERLFFDIVDNLKAKNPEAWATETPDSESSSGDRFVELKVPMWPPLEGEEGE